MSCCCAWGRYFIQQQLGLAYNSGECGATTDRDRVNCALPGRGTSTRASQYAALRSAASSVRAVWRKLIARLPCPIQCRRIQTLLGKMWPVMPEKVVLAARSEWRNGPQRGAQRVQTKSGSLCDTLWPVGLNFCGVPNFLFGRTRWRYVNPCLFTGRAGTKRQISAY